MLCLFLYGKAVAAAMNLLASAKRERENKVEIQKTEQGYNVICHVSGGNLELMRFSLYVPDNRQARMVKKNFQSAPQNVYQLMAGFSNRKLQHWQKKFLKRLNRKVYRKQQAEPFLVLPFLFSGFSLILPGFTRPLIMFSFSPSFCRTQLVFIDFSIVLIYTEKKIL